MRFVQELPDILWDIVEIIHSLRLEHLAETPAQKSDTRVSNQAQTASQSDRRRITMANKKHTFDLKNVPLEDRSEMEAMIPSHSRAGQV